MSETLEVFDYVIFTQKCLDYTSRRNVFECKHKTKDQNKNLYAEFIRFSSLEVQEGTFLILEQINNSYNKHINQIYDFFEFKSYLIIIKKKHIIQIDLDVLVNKLNKENQYFTTNQVLDFIYQFIDGYQALMKLSISHDSLQLSSICYDGQNYETIYRKYYDEARYGIAFSPPLRADYQKFPHLNDIYSFGVILYNICFLEFPFKPQMQDLYQFFATIKVTKYKIANDLPIDGPPEEKEEIKFLIENMIVFEENQRISWDALASRTNKSILYDKFRNQDQDYKYSQFQQSDQLQQSAIKFQLKFNSESEKHPLSLFILLLYQKYKLLDSFLILFSQILESNSLKCSNQNYVLIASSIVGYQKSLISQLNSIHQGNMEVISSNMKPHNNNFENNYRCVKSFQKIKTHQDIILLNCLIETLHKQQIFRHNDQLIQSTIDQIKKQQIRLQNQVDLKYLLENNILDCQHYSDLVKQFCDLYLENQIEKIIENDQPDQIPENLCLFIVCYFEIQNLERTYPQQDFQKKFKQSPQLEWTQEQIKQKIVELKQKQSRKNEIIFN